MGLFSKAFWMDAAERAVSTAAQSVVAVIGVDVVSPNALDLDYKVLAGVAAGGALLSLVKALAKLGAASRLKSGGDVE
jgi:hypothetical protein